MKPDDTLPLMTWRARPDMFCEHVNRAWVEFTGCSAEQARGEGWSRYLHPEDLARWLDVGVRAFDERRAFEIEYRLRRRDGEFRWVLERAAPLHSVEGVFLGYAGACVDIDAQKRERQSLARGLSSLLALAGAPEATRPLLSGVRVLLVGREDEGLLKPLQVAGADVRVVPSAAHARDTLGAWRPDVVLSESN